MEGQNTNLDFSINVDTAMDNESNESHLIQQYLRLRQRAILVVCAAVATLMHLHVATLTLHKSKVGMNSKDRNETRNAVMHTGSSNLSGKKRKAAQEAMMEDMYHGFADAIRDLSSALITSAAAIGNPKNDANRNGKIMSMLQEMSISEDYLVTCYLYLCKNLGEAEIFIGSTPALRGKVLEEIMRTAGRDE